MRRLFLRVALAPLVAGLAMTAAACASDTPSPSVKVIATKLNQPKKITIAPNGDLLVALSGDGKAPSTCKNGNQRSCVDASGAIDEITPSGKVTTILDHLISVSSGPSDPQATGPVQARLVDGALHVLFQGVSINAKTGQEIYGSAGSFLSDLVAFPSTSGTPGTIVPSPRIEAALGPFEAKYNPDHGRGTDIHYGYDVAIDSDPYSFVPYRGGYAIADAGANDLLFVSKTGKISVLAVFPTIAEQAKAGTFGKAQPKAIEAQAQGVPTSVAIGPDGALYVGELGGIPFQTGTESVYRVVPGHKPTVYARGFTAIGDIAFDPAGNLLVLEIDKKGLNDPGLNTGKPASGEIIEVAKGTRAQTVAVSSGLDFPTGLAVASDGTVYVANDGTTPADSGRGGEIVALKLG